MGITFDGDITGLTEKTERICLEVLKKKAFTNCVVRVEIVGKKGDNYIANVKRFIAKQNSVNDDKEFRMIVKLAPAEGYTREMMNAEIAFKNEIIVYSKLFPKFEEIQEEANIPKEQRLKHPICYATFDEAPYEAVLLEDLGESDYKVLNRFVSLTNEEAKMALKDLAKFHALSFVLRVKHPAFFNDMKNVLENIWYRSGKYKDMQEYTQQLEKESLSLLKNEEYKTRINGILSNLSKTSNEIHRYDMKSQYSTIVQGDCWTNNMMFKIKNNKPVDIIMIDYQIVRIASPASDIFYFVFNCTDYDTRKKHFYEWIEYYYENLSEFISKFGLEKNKIYPKKQFEEDLNENSKNSFAIAIMLTNLLVRESDDVTDMDGEEGSKTSDAFSISGMRQVVRDRYDKKLQEITKSCIEFGYI